MDVESTEFGKGYAQHAVHNSTEKQLLYYVENKMDTVMHFSNSTWWTWLQEGGSVMYNLGLDNDC